MRTLLRTIPERLYLRSRSLCTPNPNHALAFPSMKHALDFAERTGCRNLEVAFLSDDSRPVSAVRIDQLDELEH